jgi:hypothetical protein
MWYFIPAASRILGDHQFLIGSIIIGVSSICLALTATLKSKSDRASISQAAEGKVRHGYYLRVYVFALITCLCWTTYGIFLIKRAADDSAEKAAISQRPSHDEVLKIGWDVEERFQRVLTEANAAKREDSQNITEQKMRALRNDVSDWATALVNNLPDQERKAEDLKAEMQKRIGESTVLKLHEQLQLSARCYPVYSFAARFLEESVQAYAKATQNKYIAIHALEFSNNICAKPTDGSVRLTKHITWRIMLVPQGGVFPFKKTPNLIVVFNDYDRSRLVVAITEDETRVLIRYSGKFPEVLPSTINGEYDIADYETPIKRAIQAILNVQLPRQIK